MTTAIAEEVLRRERQAVTRAYERSTFTQSLAERIRVDQLQLAHTVFPSPLYRDRPIEFFRMVLGVEPWSRQREIIEAVHQHDRVAIASGHKISKSLTAAGLALWFYCSFPDARAIMSSTTSRQVDQILWRELRMLRARSGRCVDCKREDPEGLRIPKPCPHSALIEGEIGDLARTGLTAPDFREIKGFTAREAEAVAGISGRHLLYLLDEASGIPTEIYEAIEGNRAGGAKIVLFGNPTRNEGEFFEAFFGKSRLYFTLRISSEETPNAVSGQNLIPGLATRAWIEEKKDEWGEDSPLYKIRVKGEHVTHEEGRIFSVHAIEQAELRWHGLPDAGRLYLGIDPAGDSGMGDDSAFVPRRGLKMLALRQFTGLTEEQHVAHAVRLLIEFRLPRETPVVVIDSDGSVGIKVYRLLREYKDKHPGAFELVRIRSSEKAVRVPDLYDRVRDELTANLEQWMRDGGGIIENTQLAGELHAMEWSMRADGKLKVSPKDKLRKDLGRSPDRYDALALSCWEPLSLRQAEEEARNPKPRAEPPTSYEVEHVLDPYAASDAWRTPR